MKSIILEEWYWMSWKLCLCEHEKTVSREQESLVQKFSHGFVFCSVDTGDKIWPKLRHLEINQARQNERRPTSVNLWLQDERYCEEQGTKVCGEFSVELSQIKTSLESRVIFTIESEDNFFMAWTDEQVLCRDNISEKLRPGTEKSWLIDWLLDGEEGWGPDTADTSGAGSRVGGGSGAVWDDVEFWSRGRETGEKGVGAVWDDVEVWSRGGETGEKGVGARLGWGKTLGEIIGVGLGRDRASATVFSRPGTCTMELVNSAT